jgi:hypothetical protein
VEVEVEVEVDCGLWEVRWKRKRKLKGSRGLAAMHAGLEAGSKREGIMPEGGKM